MATQQEIQDAINALTSSSLFEDMLLLAIDTNNITQDRVIVVNTVNDLPDLSLGKVSRGTMFFVDEIKVIVIASYTKWLGLDSRVLRRDFYDETIRSWGRNQVGQLGDRTTVDKLCPVLVAGSITDWCQVSGFNHVVAVRRNGTAWAWGCGGQGRLGSGTNTNTSSPVSVLGGFTDWCQVSAGESHSLAVRRDGTAWAWGSGGSGRLGDGTTVAKSSPVSVLGNFTDWCQVSAGCAHSLGVRTNGTIWSWGINGIGGLGDGTTVNKSSPVSVVGGFTDWCQVSAGRAHSLAVRRNGTAWAWGPGSTGQLGDGTTVNKSSPVSVLGGFTDWCQVSAGTSLDHSLGLRTDGTIWSWGCNSSSQLGDGTTVNKSSPVSVLGGFTDWCRVSAGGQHSLAVRRNGTAWAWGNGTCGRLGLGYLGQRAVPVQVFGNYTNWCQVSAGEQHSLGIRFCQ
jgi:alpha-tubulin suppressor-like RCC1 family protein